jgi:hypothetical protein
MGFVSASQELTYGKDYSKGKYSYNVFQGFSKAKSANGGSILSSSQFLILPQLPQKIKLIISLPKI